MHLPHDEKSTEVKKESDLEQDKLKGTELLSHARQNAPVSELSVVLPVSTCYNLSLSWLLNWFPRPMVKLKFMAQNDEEMGGEGNVRRASAKAGEDRILVVAAEELGWLLDRDYDASRINKIFDVESGEVKKMEHVLDNLTIFGKEKGTIISDILIATNELKDLIMSVQEDLASSGEVLSQQPDVDAKDEWSADKEETYGAISGARWAERFLLKAAFNNSPYHLFIWLLVRFPKPKVRMKLMKFASRDIYEEEFTNLDMADKKGPTEVSIASVSPNEQSPYNNKKVRLNNIASFPYILRSSHVSTTNPKVGILFGVSGKIEVVEFLEKGDLLKSMKCMKDVILSIAQQSAPAVSASSLIFLSLKKLSLRFPKPMVKMKCRVVLTASWISDIDLSRHIFTESLHQLKNDEDGFDFVEFRSKFSHNCSIVGLVVLWRCTNMLAPGSSSVALDFRRNYFEISYTSSPRLGMDHIDGLIEQHYSVVEEEQHCSVSSLDLSRRRFEVSDVIKPKFLNKKLWLRRLNEDKGEDSLMSIVYLFDRCEVVIRHDPFEVFVRGRGENGKEVLSSEGLFEFEQVREEDAWLHDSLRTRNLKGNGLLQSQIEE